MLMRPKHSLDRLLTLRASGLHHLMGSVTADMPEKMTSNVGMFGTGPVVIYTVHLNHSNGPVV
jgi:hypothetical protein